MIFGCGIDIVEIERIKELRERYQERFLNHLFSEGEKKYCHRKKRVDVHLAGRFAAKEALLKALGDSVKKKLRWRDLEILNNERGKPELFLLGTARTLIENLHIKNIFLTISHDHNYAVAQVILER